MLFTIKIILLMIVLAIQTRNISSGLRENSLKKTWPELPRFHRGVGGVGVGGCPPCIFTTIQHQITLLRKKNHYLISTDAIIRKSRLCECGFDESFGIVRSIIFY